jgi:hypothetical protein
MATEEQIKQTKKIKLEWYTTWISGALTEIRDFWNQQPTSEEKKRAEIYIRTVENSILNHEKMVNQFAVVQLEMSELRGITNAEVRWLNHQNDPDKKRGKKVIDGAVKGGKESNTWKCRADELQSLANVLAINNPWLSFEDIKRQIAKVYETKNEIVSSATLKRYVKNPKTK